MDGCAAVFKGTVRAAAAALSRVAGRVSLDLSCGDRRMCVRACVQAAAAAPSPYAADGLNVYESAPNAPPTKKPRAPRRSAGAAAAAPAAAAAASPATMLPAGMAAPPIPGVPSYAQLILMQQNATYHNLQPAGAPAAAAVAGQSQPPANGASIPQQDGGDDEPPPHPASAAAAAAATSSAAAAAPVDPSAELSAQIIAGNRECMLRSRLHACAFIVRCLWYGTARHGTVLCGCCLILLCC